MPTGRSFFFFKKQMDPKHIRIGAVESGMSFKTNGAGPGIKFTSNALSLQRSDARRAQLRIGVKCCAWELTQSLCQWLSARRAAQPSEKADTLDPRKLLQKLLAQFRLHAVL